MNNFKKIAFAFLLFVTFLTAYVLFANNAFAENKNPDMIKPGDNSIPVYYTENKDKRPDYYMLTDENNVPVINERFVQIRKFDENYVIVCKQDEKGSVSEGVVDLNGNYILPAKYKKISRLYGQNKMFILANTSYGQILFDTNGKKLLSAKAIIARDKYIIARNDFGNCILYDSNLKKLLSYKDEHATQVIQRNSQIYLEVYIEGEIKYLDFKGKEVKFSE